MLPQTTWARVWRAASSPCTQTARRPSRPARTSSWATSAYMAPRRHARSLFDPDLDQQAVPGASISCRRAVFQQPAAHSCSVLSRYQPVLAALRTLTGSDWNRARLTSAASAPSASACATAEPWRWSRAAETTAASTWCAFAERLHELCQAGCMPTRENPASCQLSRICSAAKCHFLH